MVDDFIARYPAFTSREYEFGDEDAPLGQPRSCWHDAPPLWRSIVKDEDCIDVARLRAALDAGLGLELLQLRAGMRVYRRNGLTWHGADSLLTPLHRALFWHGEKIRDSNAYGPPPMEENTLAEVVALSDLLRHLGFQNSHLQDADIYADFQAELPWPHEWHLVVSAVVNSGAVANHSLYYSYHDHQPHYFEWLACLTESGLSIFSDVEASDNELLLSELRLWKVSEERFFVKYGGNQCLVPRARIDSLRVNRADYLPAALQRAVDVYGTDYELLSQRVTPLTLCLDVEAWNSRVLCVRMLKHTRARFLAFPREVRYLIANHII